MLVSMTTVTAYESGRATNGFVSPPAGRLRYAVHPALLSSVSVRLAGQALHPPTSSVTTFHLDNWASHYMTHDQFRVILEGAPSLINLSLK
jgi:hypothetical protein